MFYFEDSALEQLAVHYVGNKSEALPLMLANEVCKLDDETRLVLVNYFFNSFKDNIFHQFIREEKTESKIFDTINTIFDNPEELLEQSKIIAEHLYEQSYHPRIKSGELYVAYFQNLIVEDELVEGIGIFKTENKEIFIKTEQKDQNISLSYDKGIYTRKIDKACIVFNTEKETGYKLAIIDVAGKSKEAHYWKDEFLALEPRKDDFYQTQNYIGVCKGFVQEVYNEENGIEKADQIDMLNKTAEYFKENKMFDLDDFEKRIMDNDEIIHAFSEYKNQVAENNEIDMKNQFDISQTALKKSRAQFKSVLKLDKNFHIYIHGDRQRIVKGFDQESGLHFYQIFFEKEN